LTERLSAARRTAVRRVEKFFFKIIFSKWMIFMFIFVKVPSSLSYKGSLMKKVTPFLSSGGCRLAYVMVRPGTHQAKPETANYQCGNGFAI
jgi:hypothetical protein